MSQSGYDPFGRPEPQGPPGFAPQPQAQPAAPATETDAGVGLRSAGWIIDFALVLAAGFGVGLLTIEAGASDDAGLGWAMLASILLWVLNTTVLVAVTGGRSIGKLIAGMRLVNDDGTPAGASIGFRRDTLLRFLYAVPVFFIVDAAFAFNDDRKTLRDRMLNTRVLKVSPRPAAAWVTAFAAVCVFGAVTSGAPESWGDSSYSDRSGFIEECLDFSGAPTEQECGCYYDYALKRLGKDDFAKYVYGSPFELSDDPAPLDVELALAQAADRCAAGDSTSPFGEGERKTAALPVVRG